MRSMAISTFKAHALEAIDQVAKTQEGIVITKRGRPLAQVVPYRGPTADAVPGRLADALVFEDDIVTPLGDEMWEVCR